MSIIRQYEESNRPGWQPDPNLMPDPAPIAVPKQQEEPEPEEEIPPVDESVLAEQPDIVGSPEQYPVPQMQTGETPENLGIVVPSVQQPVQSNLPNTQMPQTDLSPRIPFERIEFDLDPDIWQGTDIPEPTMPNANNTEVLLEALRTGQMASQLMQPFNAPQPGVYDRNPFLEVIANLTGMRDVYERYYRQGVGQAGGVSGILYGLGLPLNVGLGVATDLGRIGSGVAAGIGRARESFEREMRRSNSMTDFGKRLFGEYVRGYEQQIINTDTGTPGTATQQALFGRQFSFSDERVNERGDFNPFGLLPEFGSYKRATDLKDTEFSKSVRDNVLLDSITSVIGTPVQGLLGPLSGGNIKIPKFRDWLADRVKQAELDPNNYYRAVVGFGLDAITESLMQGLSGTVQKIVDKRAAARAAAGQTSTLAPTVQLPFSWTPSGTTQRVYPRQRRLPDNVEVPLEAEVLGSRWARPRRQLPGSPNLLPGAEPRGLLPPGPDAPFAPSPEGLRTPLVPQSVEALVPPAPPRQLVPDVPTIREDGGVRMQVGDTTLEILQNPEGRRVTSWDMTEFDSEVLDLHIQRLIEDNQEYLTADFPGQTPDGIERLYDRLYREYYNRIISNPDELSRVVNDSELRQSVSNSYLENAALENILDDAIAASDEQIAQAEQILSDAERNRLNVDNSDSELSLTNLDGIFEPSRPGDITANRAAELARGFDEGLDALVDNYFQDNPLPDIFNEETLQSLDDIEFDNTMNRSSTLSPEQAWRRGALEAHTEIQQRFGKSIVNMTKDSSYGPRAFNVQFVSNKPSEIINWFKQLIADPRVDGISLILRQDDIPSYMRNRVGRVLERNGWDANWEFGYARFDNVNIREIQDTAAKVLNPRMRADRLKWRKNYYIQRIANALDRPISDFSQVRLNALYDIVNYINTRSLADRTLASYQNSSLNSARRGALIRSNLESIINENYPELPTQYKTAILRSHNLAFNMGNYMMGVESFLENVADELGFTTNPQVVRLIEEMRTPNVIEINSAFDELTLSLPSNQRGASTDQVYRYRLQEFVNASTELEDSLVRLNELQAARVALEPDISVTPQMSRTRVDPLNPVFYFGTRADNFGRGSVLAQSIETAQDIARSVTTASEQVAGGPRLVEYRNDSLLVLPEAESMTLRRQLEEFEQTLDPESFAVVKDEILATLGQDYDITADGVVLNPNVFQPGAVTDIADVTDGVQLRTAEFNANPSQETAANLQAQLIDQLDERLEQGYAGLDESISRYFDSADALMERSETLRDATLNNPNDFPVRQTDEAYRAEVERYIAEDPRLQEWLEVTPPSPTYYRVWNQYADEIFEAVRLDDPDRIIDTAVNYRQLHTGMRQEAAELYEKVVEVYTELKQRQGEWVPDDFFPILEDIC